MLDYKALIEEYSDKENGYTYPYWGELADILERDASDEDLDTVYEGLSKEWMLRLKANLAGDFELRETPNFLILSNENAHTKTNLAYHCERSLKLILGEFGGALKDTGYGKHILIVFKRVEEYFNYISYFASDGENPASGGICINSGYVHIVLPMIIDDRSPIAEITHELSHALLASYELPNWVDEAIAMRMEDIAVEYDGLSLNKESYKAHQLLWNQQTIQEFWSGEVWASASSAFELSYELARILWKKIAVDLQATKEEIVEFLERLSRDDAGNAAFKAIFNHSLGDLVEDFLGEGDWEPDEEYLKQRSQAYVDAPRWFEEIQHLAELSREDMLSQPVTEIKPSPAMAQLLKKLQSVTIGDLINTPVERVFEYRAEMEENSPEGEVKLGILGLTMQYDLDLIRLSNLFSIFQDGKIVGGYQDYGKCTLMLDVRYLAEMIHPTFKQFKIEFQEFGGYVFEPSPEIVNGVLAPSMESVSFEQMVRLNLEITGVKVSIGKITISCANQGGEKPAGELSFYATEAMIYDDEGREWSLERLEKLADEYWDGG